MKTCRRCGRIIWGNDTYCSKECYIKDRDEQQAILQFIFFVFGIVMFFGMCGLAYNEVVSFVKGEPSPLFHVEKFDPSTQNHIHNNTSPKKQVNQNKKKNQASQNKKVRSNSQSNKKKEVKKSNNSSTNKNSNTK